MSLTYNYTTVDGQDKYFNAFPVYLPMFAPLRTVSTFLPYSLQPTAAPGRGGTSNPIQMTTAEMDLLFTINSQFRQQNWLVNNNPGFLYRRTNEKYYWSSAVGLAANQVLIDRTEDEWLHVVGIPNDAAMTFENINPVDRPYWCHRVWIRNFFQKPHDVFTGSPTYSLMFDRLNRPNSYYPDGSLWIKYDQLALWRQPLPGENF